MGKWSTYRRRGSVSNALAAPSEVLLLERAEATDLSIIRVGFSGTRIYQAAKPLISASATWTITRIQVFGARTAGGSSNTYSVVIWPAVASLPALPRTATSIARNNSTMPATADWTEFLFASNPVLANPFSVFVGMLSSTPLADGFDWRLGGTLGSGENYNGATDPPLGDNTGDRQPWMRIYGYLS